MDIRFCTTSHKSVRACTIARLSLTEKQATGSMLISITAMNKDVSEVRNIPNPQHAFVQIPESPCITLVKSAPLTERKAVCPCWDTRFTHDFVFSILIFKSIAKEFSVIGYVE